MMSRRLDLPLAGLTQPCRNRMFGELVLRLSRKTSDWLGVTSAGKCVAFLESVFVDVRNQQLRETDMRKDEGKSASIKMHPKASINRRRGNK